VIKAGFVDLLLKCMSERRSRLDLKAQAAWALGNVAGESPDYREELMKKGFTRCIVDVLSYIYEDTYDEATISQHNQGRMQFNDEDYYSNVEALLWALSNMSRGGFRVAEYYQNASITLKLPIYVN
jgi:hypothetical protein